MRRTSKGIVTGVAPDRAPNRRTIMTPDSVPFVQMGIGGKLIFLMKLCVFLCTMGFAFPLLLSN